MEKKVKLKEGKKVIKKIIALFLALSLVLTGCSTKKSQEVSLKGNEKTTSTVDNHEANQVTEQSVGTDSIDELPVVKDNGSLPLINKNINIKEGEDDKAELVAMSSEEYAKTLSFDGLEDENLLRYVKDNLYEEIVSQIDSDEYFVQNIETVYISKEYVDELTYNSQTNVFFGYTLAELEEQFQGERYIFTLADDGSTIAVPFEDYDDTFEQVIKNVAIGTGVILVCVVISVASAGVGAPAVSMIFAASAKTATAMAVSSGALSGVAAGVVKGFETGDIDEALKAGALAGSEGFKWGAISGAISGGAGEAVALKGATAKGLTMNEVATIQKESKYPLDVIKEIHSMKEYEALKAANLKPYMVDGRTALVRSDIDLNHITSNGKTNLELMQEGKAPLDAFGKKYQLHHIGQENDATLAILTEAEHHSDALHGFKTVSEIDRPAFDTIRKSFWRTMAEILSNAT